MNDFDRIEIIRNLGLTEYEAKCYLSLFRKESLSVSDIVAIAEVPQANVYGTMKKLQARGLCILMPGKIKKFAAADPQLFRQKSLQVIDKSRKNVNDLADELDTLYKVTRQNNSPLDYIEIFKDPGQIHYKFIELFSKAEKEVLGFTKPPLTYGSEEQMREQVGVQLAAFDRNVVLRNVVQMPSDELVKTFTKNGLIFPDKAIKGRKRDQHCKFVDELPAKLFVFDERVCFFALEDPIKTKTSLTMLVAEHEAMAKSFKLLFETVWEKANDYFIIDNKKYYLYEPEEEE